MGTVEHLGAATMTDVPIDDRTAVVRVDQVLHAPAAFATLAGHRITLQLAADKAPVSTGETLAFFAEGLAFGESIAVTEVGRLALEALQPRLTEALETGQAGDPLAELQQRAEQDRLREHAEVADAIVIGRVIKLEKALPGGYSEHDPDWWQATLDVNHVERGDVEPGPLVILYANSLDVDWRVSPKPRASQHGLWILHATEGDLADAARFAIVHPEDFQPLQSLDALREGRG